MCARSSIIIPKNSNCAIYAIEKDKEMYEFVFKATKGLCELMQSTYPPS
jgi:hypothetical protein